MRNAPDLTDAILAAPHGVNCRVRVIYGDDFIADDVPVESGTLTATDGNAVPERVTLQVPVRDSKGRVWEPSEPTSPLNNFGQRLEISYQIIPRRHSAAIDIPLGQFRINNWDVNAGKVSVNAEGLLALVEESIFTVPASPLVGQTFRQAIAWILDDIIPLVFHPGLPEDEVITEVLQWDRDRLGAVFDILDAWAVRGRVSSEGVFVVEPLSSIDTELFSWTDGQNGTVVSAPRSGSRDGIFNAVVARSSANELS